MKTVRSVCTLPDETRTRTAPDFDFDVSTAVDAPVDLIVATLDGDAVQTSAGVVIVFPFVSTARTVNVIVLFVCITSVGMEDVTISESSTAGGGGGVGTVTVAVPNLPSLVAVIVAVPGATPVTTPAVVTVATPALDVDHVITRPESGFPLASSVAADSVADAPIAI